MMPLDSEAIDINQLQQIMRLTGTPPASLISRMPSHEVRYVPSAFHVPRLTATPQPGIRAPADIDSPVYRQIPLDLMCGFSVFLNVCVVCISASALTPLTPCFLSDSPCLSQQGFPECFASVF